jgi:transposase-like protein
MLVAVDKFTKWVEAALVTTQDSTTAINFIKSIVFRFGVHHIIITDNGTNLTSKEFKSKRASRKSKRPNMQRNKEEVASTTGESQARLGR